VRIRRKFLALEITIKKFRPKEEHEESLQTLKASDNLWELEKIFRPNMTLGTSNKSPIKTWARLKDSMKTPRKPCISLTTWEGLILQIEHEEILKVKWEHADDFELPWEVLEVLQTQWKPVKVLIDCVRTSEKFKAPMWPWDGLQWEPGQGFKAS